METVLGLYKLFQPTDTKGLRPSAGALNMDSSAVGRRASGRVRVELNPPAAAPEGESAAPPDDTPQLRAQSVGRRASGRVQGASEP